MAELKPRAQRQVAAVVAVALAAVTQKWWAAAGVVAVAAAVWLWRLKRHPMGPCWSCRGRSGRNIGSDPAQWGRCARCEKTPGGSGEEPRLGAQLVRPDLRRK